MFQVLLESGTRAADRRTGWTLVSAVGHAALIATAVALTIRDTFTPLPRQMSVG